MHKQDFGDIKLKGKHYRENCHQYWWPFGTKFLCNKSVNQSPLHPSWLRLTMKISKFHFYHPNSYVRTPSLSKWLCEDSITIIKMDIWGLHFCYQNGYMRTTFLLSKWIYEDYLQTQRKWCSIQMNAGWQTLVTKWIRRKKFNVTSLCMFFIFSQVIFSRICNLFLPLAVHFSDLGPNGSVESWLQAAIGHEAPNQKIHHKTMTRSHWHVISACKERQNKVSISKQFPFMPLCFHNSAIIQMHNLMNEPTEAIQSYQLFSGEMSNTKQSVIVTA